MAIWQGATVLQLFPYSWDLPDGSVIREQVYSGMAEAVNATYWRWVNPDVGLAYFRRCACRLGLQPKDFFALWSVYLWG